MGRGEWDGGRTRGRGLFGGREQLCRRGELFVRKKLRGDYVGEESSRRRESAPQQLLGVRMDWRRESGLVVVVVSGAPLNE